MWSSVHCHEAVLGINTPCIVCGIQLIQDVSAMQDDKMPGNYASYTRSRWGMVASPVPPAVCPSEAPKRSTMNKKELLPESSDSCRILHLPKHISNFMLEQGTFGRKGRSKGFHSFPAPLVAQRKHGSIPVKDPCLFIHQS